MVFLFHFALGRFGRLGAGGGVVCLSSICLSLIGLLPVCFDLGFYGFCQEVKLFLLFLSLFFNKKKEHKDGWVERLGGSEKDLGRGRNMIKI